MAWSITGKRTGLVLSVSDSGSPVCHGRGLHELAPPSLHDFGHSVDHTLLRRIRAAECSWSLHSSTESELQIDSGGVGLFARVQESRGVSHGMFMFYEHSLDAVTCAVVVPKETFSHIRRLLELVLLSDSLGYAVVAEFHGFRVPHAQTETPTLQEFVEGRPLFFSKVSFSVQATE